MEIHGYIVELWQVLFNFKYLCLLQRVTKFLVMHNQVLKNCHTFQAGPCVPCILEGISLHAPGFNIIIRNWQQIFISNLAFIKKQRLILLTSHMNLSLPLEPLGWISYTGVFCCLPSQAYRKVLISAIT